MATTAHTTHCISQSSWRRTVRQRALHLPSHTASHTKHLHPHPLMQTLDRHSQRTEIVSFPYKKKRKPKDEVHCNTHPYPCSSHLDNSQYPSPLIFCRVHPRWIMCTSMQKNYGTIGAGLGTNGLLGHMPHPIVFTCLETS